MIKTIKMDADFNTSLIPIFSFCFSSFSIYTSPRDGNNNQNLYFNVGVNPV
jgi:hypothetical protein